MSLLFLDSFEHYVLETEDNGTSMSVDMERGNYLDCHACDVDATTGVRSGSRGLKFGNKSIGGGTFIDSWAKHWVGDDGGETKLIVGFSFHVLAPSNELTPIYKFFHDNGLNEETLLVEIRRTSTNGIAAYDGLGVLMGQSAGNVLNLSSLNYVEIKVQFFDTTGEVVVRIDNCEILNLQNVNTVAGAGSPGEDVCNVHGPYTTWVTLGSDASTKHVYDDFYVANGDGPLNNDFIGDISVVTLVPEGVGEHTEWGSESSSSPSDPNWMNVDELTPDDDVTYNWANTTGLRDTYALPDLPSGALEVAGVMVQGYLRKEIGGTKEVALKVLLAGGSPEMEINSPGIATDTAYSWHTHVFETMPGGGAWTPGDVNAMEIGVEVVEGSPS